MTRSTGSGVASLVISGTRLLLSLDGSPMQTHFSKRSRFVALLTGIGAILLCRGYATGVAPVLAEAAIPSQPVMSITAESWLAQAATKTVAGGSLVAGSTGSKVKELQQRLKEKGFDPGPLDSTFGLSTKAAVIAFQKSKGLEADGVVGPKTLAALGIKLPVTSQSSSTASPKTKSSQINPSSADPTPTQGIAYQATQAPVVVADRFYWSGPKGNLGLSLVGKFDSPEKLRETFVPAKVLSVFSGRRWILSDILVSVDFNANGSAASWKVSGPRPVLEQYLATLKAGYQNKTLLYDFSFSEIDFRPTASLQPGEQGIR